MPAPETVTPDHVIARAMAALDRLEAVLKQETEALRSGNLAAGLDQSAEKADAAATHRTVLAEISQISPSALAAHANVEELRRKHLLFERTVSLNLAVIATMRSVAEGILREVSDRMAPVTPAAYGPPGHRQGSATPPISLSLRT